MNHQNIEQNNRLRVYFPNLDGLRFFCFLFVFLYHSFATEHKYILENKFYVFVKCFLAGNGNLGVNFFFVLSGFLITYLLIIERISFKSINIGSFYVRRILRIWPLYYLCVVIGFLVFPILKSYFGQIPNETAHPFYYLFFISNFDIINNGLPDASVLGILWSVSIEEQFYLVWPILLSLIPAKYYKIVFVSILILTLIFRFFNISNLIVLEMHTFSCISDMAIGGAAATLIYYSKKFYNHIVELSKFKLYILYIIAIAILLFRKEIFMLHDMLHVFERVIISTTFALIILEQCYAKNSIFKMSNYKIISRLGTYTYGLYCLHMIAILIVATILRILGLNKTVFQVIFLEGGLSLLLTIGLAYVSFKYFESFFLRFKYKFARITK